MGFGDPCFIEYCTGGKASDIAHAYSSIKTFKIPHVIVMSNEYPDETRMKKSRIWWI